MLTNMQGNKQTEKKQIMKETKIFPAEDNKKYDQVFCLIFKNYENIMSLHRLFITLAYKFWVH